MGSCNSPGVQRKATKSRQLAAEGTHALKFRVPVASAFLACPLAHVLDLCDEILAQNAKAAPALWRMTRLLIVRSERVPGDVTGLLHLALYVVQSPDRPSDVPRLTTAGAFV